MWLTHVFIWSNSPERNSCCLSTLHLTEQCRVAIPRSCLFLSALIPLAFWAGGDDLLTDLELSSVRIFERIVLSSRVCLYETDLIKLYLCIFFSCLSYFQFLPFWFLFKSQARYRHLICPLSPALIFISVYPSVLLFFRSSFLPSTHSNHQPSPIVLLFFHTLLLINLLFNFCPFLRTYSVDCWASCVIYDGKVSSLVNSKIPGSTSILKSIWAESNVSALTSLPFLFPSSP